MKTKTYTVYTFAELTGPARQKAIDDHSQFLANEWDGDVTQEDAKQALAFAGFTVDEIHYSGFSSQGDGACFTGSWRAADVNPTGMRDYAPVDTELHRIADKLAALASAWPLASFTVKQTGGYMHEFCTAFNFNFPELPEGEEPGRQADLAEAEITDLARDAMRWIYRQLEKDYEYCTAEPQVIESIEANEYEFTADGKLD